MRRLFGAALLMSFLAPTAKADSLHNAEKWIYEAMDLCKEVRQEAEQLQCVHSEWVLIIESYKVITYLRDNSVMSNADYSRYLQSVIKSLSQKVSEQIRAEARAAGMATDQYGVSSKFLTNTFELISATPLENYSLPSQLLKVLSWQIRLASYKNLAKIPREYELQYAGAIKKLDQLIDAIINP